MVWFLSVTAGYGQTDSVTYFDDSFNHTQKDKTTFYRVTQITDPAARSGSKKDFYITGEKYQEQHYSKLDSVLHGPSITWYKSGQLKSRTHYSHGYPEGTSEDWFEDGTLKWIHQYVHGRLEGERRTYYANKQLKRRDVYSKGELVEGHCYDEQGMKIPYYEFEVMPQYPGGMPALKRYLSKKIKVTVNRSRKEQEGEVLLSFIINKEGGVENISVVKTTHQELADAGIKALLAMPKWKPGSQDGREVSVKYNVPYKVRFN
ncbi:hypothetical protein GCM10023183_26650 [Nibribacter koreensis]|uniref:TonB C-terminal domain-containing protein n=1 Tax=Nibribacter koreensis TaxID=1084519 RepID=A0ABP8FRT9_9BACT